jgi:DNA-binding response OmpR family regulator
MRIDMTGRQLQIDGALVELTGREWLVLECLALNANRVVSKERLQQTAMGWDQAVTPNAVEVYVSRLRTKLAEAATIRAIRGLGYRLELEQIPAAARSGVGARDANSPAANAAPARDAAPEQP